MNKSLVLGSVLVAFFLCIAIFGGLIAPYSIDYNQDTTYKDGKICAPPNAPTTDHLLGTNYYGEDIFSMLMYGAKYTIFTAIIVSLFRVIIGSFIGMFLGIKTMKKKKTIISSAALGTIPTFLIVYFLLVPINFQIESTEISIRLLAITAIICILVGIPSIISSIREKTELIMKKEFVDSAKVLGANSKRLIFKHIFPQLIESLLTLFVTEIVLVLTLFGQLALFDIFIGGTVVYYGPLLLDTITGEWAGLIGQARMYIYSNKWIVLGPMFAYLILILSFQILSKGINEYFKKKLHNYPYI